uniref:VTT domain-containing protein n=1 Tax=Quercus lobata TaxID=97700 RepID=A0A7N2N1W2_QUELO
MKREEENSNGVDVGSNSKFPLSFWEVTAASTVLLGFLFGLVGVYFTMPASDYSFLKLPRNLEDLQILRISASGSDSLYCVLHIKIGCFAFASLLSVDVELDFMVIWIVIRYWLPAVLLDKELDQLTMFCLQDHLESYTSDYTAQVLVGYCMVYIFMQTFMIPGTVFMSLLAGSLFGVFRGVALVVFTATAGASSCYFLSKLIGRPIVFSIWPDKLKFFQAQVAKRKQGLLNYMLFLRLTPTLPNTFINFASPIVDVPYHIFFLATIIGLIPAAFVTVRAGLALGELQSVGDLYDFQSIATLFFIGIVSITPTLVRNKDS